MTARLRTALCLTVLGLAAGCPGASSAVDGGPPVDDLPDAAALPDGYGPLWPCKAPGQPCNAHDHCAIDPTCGADRLCRPAALQSCDDGLACTDDRCAGTGLCDNRPRAGFCALPVRVAADGGPTTTEVRCFVKGEIKSGDPCSRCDPDADPRTWSPASGAPCDDGDPCTRDDRCVDGQCKGTYYGGQCVDEYGCTENPCDGQGGCLGNPIIAGWCLINGACVKDGVVAPTLGCQVCDTGRSQTAWSLVGNTCFIEDACYLPGDKNPYDQGCGSCDPTTSTTQWTYASTSCIIGNTCFPAGAVEPGGCGVCDSSQNKTAWTRPAGCDVVYTWAKAFGSAASDHARGVAVDASGNVYIAGHADGTIDFGGSPLTGAGLFVASFTPDGAHRWSKRISAYNSTINGIAVDSNGNVYVTGYFHLTIDLGGGPVTAKGGTDVFVASLTSKGAHRWSKAFGSAVGSSLSDYDYGQAIAADASGNVHVTGNHAGPIDFGGGPLPGNGAFMASFTATGAHRWSKALDGLGGSYGGGIAADAGGNVHVVGHFSGSLDLGGGPLTSNGPADAFVASYTSTGAHRWSKALSGPGGEYGFGVATDTAGNVHVTGYFAGSLDLGSGTMTSVDTDAFVVSYTSTGAHRWSKAFGSSGYDYGRAITVDAADNVHVTGSYQSSIDLGGGAVPGKGAEDVFIVSFGSTGTYRWGRGHGGPGNDQGLAVAIDSSGRVYVTGHFFDALELGGGPMSGSGGYDVFLLQLAP